MCSLLTMLLGRYTRAAIRIAWIAGLCAFRSGITTEAERVVRFRPGHTYVVTATVDHGPVTYNDERIRSLTQKYANHLGHLLEGHPNYYVVVVLPGAAEQACDHVDTVTCDLLVITESTGDSPTRPNITFTVASKRFQAPVRNHPDTQIRPCPPASGGDAATIWAECPYDVFVRFDGWFNSVEPPAHHWR